MRPTPHPSRVFLSGGTLEGHAAMQFSSMVFHALGMKNHVRVKEADSQGVRWIAIRQGFPPMVFHALRMKNHVRVRKADSQFMPSCFFSSSNNRRTAIGISSRAISSTDRYGKVSLVSNPSFFSAPAKRLNMVHMEAHSQGNAT